MSSEAKGETIPPEVLAYPRAIWLWGKLRRYARYMAARYNGAVYLCGSALTKDHPRDIDIRVEIADNEFARRYGYEHWSDFSGAGPNQRWIDDMAKRNAELATDYRLNPDFQVYAASHCIQMRTKPRILLAGPTGILAHLAASTEWWDQPTYGYHL